MNYESMTRSEFSDYLRDSLYDFFDEHLGSEMPLWAWIEDVVIFLEDDQDVINEKCAAEAIGRKA